MSYTKVFALNQQEIRERIPLIMINFLNLKKALINKDKDNSETEKQIEEEKLKEETHEKTY